MKRLLVAVVALLLLVPLLGALATLPAHRQIRAVAPALPDYASLRSALAVTDGPVAISYVNTASQSGPLGTLGHPGVLLQWADGRMFLIDTGMPPQEAVAFGRPMEWLLGAQPTQAFGSLAQQLGERAQRIDGIGFTHLHSDHTDGLPEICAARPQPAGVYQTPLQYSERNYTTDIGFAALQAARCPIRELDAAQVMSIPGFPGLVLVSLGGHTPGSTLFAVRIGARYLLFSGDITNDRRSLLEDLPKPWLYSTFIVPEDTARTSVLRHWLKELDTRDDVVVFPAHDVEHMARHLPAATDTGL
ncbi:MAG: MBL fold metallo-hydrolase [Halioglobus sp.]|nr:MBL fold metallo-hydrolase [Halioglobus sp.]